MGKRLYVGNLPYDADEEAIRTAFSQGGGTVERVHIPLDRETQRPRGFAFVEMASDEQAKQAIGAMDGATIGTRTLRVSEAEERRPPGGGGPRPGPRPDRPRHDRPHGGGEGRRDDRDRDAVDGGDGGDGDGGDRDPSERAREARERRFGPDARPSRERERERSRGGGKRGHGRRRHEQDDSGRGRRGGGYEDDLDY